MIRLTALTLAILFLSAYAWRDWYKSLCALIVFMAVVSYSSMPRAMFGIAGVSPFNFLFANILLSFASSYRREGLSWGLPPKVNLLLAAYLAVVLLAVVRFGLSDVDLSPAYAFINSVPPPTSEVFIDYFVNGIKWVLPAILLYVGCNSRSRLQLGVLAILLMYFMLAVLVIRWMPLSLLADGDAMQSRAIRVLDRELGYYRTNLSVMFAGAFWVFVFAKNYFPKKYSIVFTGASAIVLLAMFLTGGRGGYMAWAIFALFVAFVRYRRYLILAPTIVMLVFALVPSVQDRVIGGDEDVSTSTAFTSDQDAELASVSAGRTETWPRVVEEIIESPIVGYGFNGIVISGVTLSLIDDFDYTFFHPHNAYLQILVDNGLLGSMPILILFFVIVTQAWALFMDSSKSDYVLAGGIALAMVLTFLAAGFTGQSFYPEERSVGLWCAVALMARVAVQRQKYLSSSQ